VSAADPALKAVDGSAPVISLLVVTGLASSRSEAGRLIEQGAIAINEERVSERDAMWPMQAPLILRRGKRQFVKVIFD
jgi:tyrosyl-tRNA synthetase